jgi:hypothetical protein
MQLLMHIMHTMLNEHLVNVHSMSKPKFNVDYTLIQHYEIIVKRVYHERIHDWYETHQTVFYPKKGYCIPNKSLHIESAARY